MVQELGLLQLSCANSYSFPTTDMLLNLPLRAWGRILGSVSGDAAPSARRRKDLRTSTAIGDGPVVTKNPCRTVYDRHRFHKTFFLGTGAGEGGGGGMETNQRTPARGLPIQHNSIGPSSVPLSPCKHWNLTSGGYVPS